MIAKSRAPPSFSAYEVRSFIGQRGHGVRSSGRFTGGSPSTSICVTDAAPSRWALATQSAPVSPPPITITCLPAAVIGRSAGGGASGPGGADLGRDRRGRGRRGSPSRSARRRARGPGQEGRAGRGSPSRARPRRGSHAARRRRGRRRCRPRSGTRRPPPRAGARRRSTSRFSILNSGHAEADEPAARLVALVDGDRVPGPVQLLGTGEARRDPRR